MRASSKTFCYIKLISLFNAFLVKTPFLFLISMSVLTTLGVKNFANILERKINWNRFASSTTGLSQ